MVACDPVYDLARIQAILPHRDPFLFIDEVLELEPGKRIRARRKVTGREDFFRGHYPDRPIMPGVLLCECVFQAGALLIAAEVDMQKHSHKVPVVTRIKGAKFRKPVRPGDELEITAEITEQLNEHYYLKGQITCNGKVASVEFGCTLAELEL